MNQFENSTLEFKWTVSRGQDTYGYNLCSLYVDGQKKASTCGGGYDMKGAALGDWVARAFKMELLALPIDRYPAPRNRGNTQMDPVREFYGLTFHDPKFDPSKAVIGTDCQDRTLSKTGNNGKTVQEAESAGESFGLERYQAFYKASSPVPTSRHNVPLIDGACGFSCVEDILKALGYRLEYIHTRSKNISLYKLRALEAVTA